MSQRLRIIVILGKVNSSGDVCVNGDNTGSPEGMGTWGLVPTFLHTAGLDTIFVQIYMDPPPGVTGVSKDAPGSTKQAT